VENNPFPALPFWLTERFWFWESGVAKRFERGSGTGVVLNRNPDYAKWGTERR